MCSRDWNEAAISRMNICDQEKLSPAPIFNLDAYNEAVCQALSIGKATVEEGDLIVTVDWTEPADEER